MEKGKLITFGDVVRSDVAIKFDVAPGGQIFPDSWIFFSTGFCLYRLKSFICIRFRPQIVPWPAATYQTERMADAGLL